MVRERYAPAARTIAIQCIVIVLSAMAMCDTAFAVSHTVYLAHPNALPAARDHSYAQEIERLRHALTDAVPAHEYVARATPAMVDPSPSTQSRATQIVPTPLRITRATRTHSVITIANLAGDNQQPQQTIDLIVRDRDLYVMGFVNGPEAQRTFYRLRTPPERQHAHIPVPPSMLGTPSTLLWATHRTTDLQFSYDYPSMEYTASIGRYLGNVDISLESLRGAVAILSEYTGSTTERAEKKLAAALIRIIVAYFEGARFRSISQAITDAGFDNGQEWIVTPREARITNAWRELTTFGSLNALNDTNTQTLSLRGQNGVYRFSASLNDLTHASWYRTTAIVLVTQWHLTRQNSCPPAINRRPRDLSSRDDICKDTEEKKSAENILMRFGNTYYQNNLGSALYNIL